MSDIQRNVKMATEQSLANLVERARRLQLSSVATIMDIFEDDEDDGIMYDGEDSSLPELIDTTKKHKNNNAIQGTTMNESNSGSFSGPRSAVGTARKIRRVEAEPVPPPPSPREYYTIGDLMDDYNSTDKLIDQMLLDANLLNQEIYNCSLHLRDVSLVQEIELETTSRSIDKLFGALSAECDRNDLKDTLKRCDLTLERFKEPLCSDYGALVPSTLLKSQIISSSLNFNSLNEDKADIADGYEKLELMELTVVEPNNSSPTKNKCLSNLQSIAEQVAK